MTRSRTRTRTVKRGRTTGKTHKINREHRRQLHAIWPPLVMGPLYRVVSEVRYLVRDGTWGDGLTPKEKEYVYNRVQEIDRLAGELADLYYKRLKF